MAVRLFHLKPLSPFHLGEATGAMDRVSEVAHSDTVFSGLCHAWLRLYGTESLEALLRDMRGESPPLRLSSAFPFWEKQGGEIVYYLPWPRGGELSLRFRDRKAAKRVPFLPLKLFERFFAAEPAAEGPEGHARRTEVSEEDEQSLKEEAEKLSEGIKVDTRVSAALCRLTMSAVPYHLSALRFSEGWGLYLFLDGDEEWLRMAEGALRLLGDMGLGGDRSSGYGCFRLESGDASLFDRIMGMDGGRHMALSVVFPRPEERGGLAGSRIALLERKGWIDSPETRRAYRRKRVLLVEEGSVLSAPVRGTLVDVTPEGWPGHRVYRYGIGFYLPVAL